MITNFFYCMDTDYKIPSMCPKKPDRPTWIRYRDDTPVMVSHGWNKPQVWDYKLSRYVDADNIQRCRTVIG